jgi:hypothetical protein
MRPATIRSRFGYGGLLVLTWFVASAARWAAGWVGSDPRGRVLQARGGPPQPARGQQT